MAQESKCDKFDGESKASSGFPKCEELSSDGCVDSNKRQKSTETHEMLSVKMAKGHIENKEEKFDSCEGKPMASSYCSECGEYLCDECVDSHKKQTITETHEMLPAEMGQEHKNDDKEQIEETICVYMCEPCDGESTASSYCPECKEFLCEECVKSHKKMKATKKHEILAAEMGKDHKTMGDENKKIEKNIDVYMCEPCDGESTASSYCPECEEYLCEECVKSHKKMKATKKHEILAAEMGKDHKSMTYEYEKNVPGKPIAVEAFPDSVLLAWDRPPTFGDKSCFQISFKDMSSNQRWRTYHEEIFEDSTTITGLKSNATYVFRVRVINEEGEESPYSLESEAILTAASLATKMFKTSIQVTNWDKTPSKFALPIKENIAARNEIAKTRKFEVGSRPYGYFESKTIMLVGATGTGKSTFVDAIINYVLGVTWEDPFRYTIINLEAEEKGRIQNQAVSQTEWITCYTINPEEGSRLSYQLHIIDTPGFGDTRGIKRDQEIVGQIRELFSDTGPRGVSCIDAVCFLIKAPDARLTPIQSYIFQSIMSLFGKDIEKNICSLITFADGNDPPVLAALKESELPFGEYFTFNNSALFATNSGMESQSLSPIFWDIGLTSFDAFFKHLGQMHPQSLQLTKDVLLERYRLEAIVRTLKDNLDAGLQMVEVLKSEKNVLKQHKTAMEANKNFEVEVSEPTVIKTLIPGRVHNTKCDNCYVKCHERCIYEDNEEKRKCWAMDDNGKCTICPDHCDWTAHKNDAFTYTHGVKKVMKTLNELKEKYTDARGKAKSHEEMVAKNAAELQELTNNIEDMMLLVKFCNEKLQEIALKPNPLTITEHIDLMIENEKLTRREGYLMRIKVLNEFRKDAEVHKEVEVFKRVAEVELGETYSEKKKETRPMDSKSVIRRAAQWLMKRIPNFSI